MNSPQVKAKMVKSFQIGALVLHCNALPNILNRGALIPCSLKLPHTLSVILSILVAVLVVFFVFFSCNTVFQCPNERSRTHHKCLLVCVCVCACETQAALLTVAQGCTCNCPDCHVSQFELRQGLYSETLTPISLQAVVVVEWLGMKGGFIASAKEQGAWQSLSGSPFASAAFGQQVAHSHFVGSAMREWSLA